MAQIISEANNKDARTRLVDVMCSIEDIEDYLRVMNVLVDQFDLFKPMISLLDGIGERVDKMRQDMLINNKTIYDVLEDTKLRDKEVRNN